MRHHPLSLILAVWLVACPAAGDVAVEARFFDQQARHAFSLGKYDDALHAFLLANAIAPSPREAYNIALCAELSHESGVAFTYYREYLASSDSDSGRRADAERRFKKLEKGLALVEVTSTPPGARVYADRVELGSHGVTPTTIVVAPGEHQLIVEREGYATASVPAQASKGAPAKVDVVLDPRYGKLSVRFSPASAKVELSSDGSQVAPRFEAGVYVLPVGRYSVRISAPGYLAAEADVVVHEVGAADVQIEATPLPRPTGRLLVASPGIPADVWLDGERVALTPATLSSTPAGPHQLEVRAKGRRWQRSILVLEGKTAYWQAQWGEAKP